MSVTIQTNVTLEVVDCYSCGMLFGVPTRWNKDRVQDRKSFYCPNGHSQHYIVETEAEKLRRELGQIKADRTFWQEEAERQKRTATAVKGQLTRAKNRAATGVCQECHRTFQNVARHNHTKHGPTHDQSSCAVCKGSS